MTLILSCLTPKYVIQVSDSRLSRNRVPLKKGVNKAVVFRHALTFAYTGLSKLRGKPTDRWLGEVLLPHASNGREALDAVGQAAANVPELIRAPHAFVAVGYADERTPIYVGITNCMDDDGRWAKAVSGWQCHLFWASEGQVRVFSAGQRVPDVRLRGMEKSIAARGLETPKYAADVLTGCIRQVATGNPTVSLDVLVSCIPLIAYQTQDMGLGLGEPNLLERSFATRDPAGSHYVHHIPVVIAAPNVMLSDFSIEAGPEVSNPGLVVSQYRPLPSARKRRQLEAGAGDAVILEL